MSHTLLPSTALVVFLLLTGLLRDALAQSTDAEIEERYHKEHGNFFLRNYSSKDYKNASDNWGVLEDKSGNMIFANGNGLMIYDGKTWTLIETPTQSVIRSMVHDQDGRLYIGALDDVGYLSQTPYGKNIYVSLLDSIPPDQRQMGNVWSTHVLNNEIYFESEAGLYIWNKKAFRFIPWVTPGAWHKSFVWNNHLYLSEEGTGLLMLNGNQFTAAEGGSDFKTRRIYTAMPVNQHQIIFGTKFDGLFSYNGHHAVPIISDATPYFKEFEIYAGISLGNKTLAVASKFGGVLIINTAGKVLSMISRDQGLKTNDVRAIAADRNGDLWMALDEGLSHIEISNGLEYYDESAGLASAVNDIVRFGDRIYINNNTGTYVLVPSELPNRRARFQRIDIPKEAGSWGFLEVNKRLLISTSVGVFELNDNKLMQLTRAAAFALLKLKGDSSRILIAEEQSIQSLRLKNGKWIPAVGVPDMHIDNVKFNETIAGKVWITTFSQGATLISYQKDNSVVNYDKPVVTRYGTADGLPEGFIKISSVHDYESFRVGTESLLLKFDYKTNRFVPDSLFTKTFGFNIPVFPTNNASADGAFLMKAKKRDDGIRKIFVVNRDQSGYKSEHFDMSRITENVGVMTYWDRANNEIWHVGMEMMVRQKLIHPRRDTSNFNAHLNKIIINGDSVLYEGTGASPIKSVVPHALSSFRFEFTSNNFVAESQNVFQYKLQGYDDEWSEWSGESIKEYSRLWEGDYIFLVRSKDYAGVISREDKFSFIVRPPWYRSILAFIVYAAIVAFAIWNLLRWRSRKLEKEKIALQKEIDLQTQEIRTQNVRLGEQSEELRINAEQLKELDTLKSNFFVNISHEFRTPLSLILGPLEKVMENHASGVRLPELQRMHRSAKRLQQLINQLLDLAKLEAGQMKVVERQQDVLYHLRVLTASFESLADVRNIKYDVTIPIGSFDASLDVDKFETIIYNLLSNAFKFTPEGGTIYIACTLEIQEISLLTIKITDNGPGIPESAIDKIFNRFYQVDSSSSREYEGSGIGLSLVKELITLLNGDVQVESKHGEGTSFTVSLPMQGNLLIEDELLQNDLSASGFANIAQGMSNDNTVQSASEELILIVEDNADLRAYLQESLQSDYNIEVAENGEVGLSKAIELTPDLILSDMMMPKMDGFTLCTTIRADERISHIPFILLTARTTIESKLLGLELGADEYMTKPFNIREVQVRIKNLLEQRKNLRRSYAKQVTLQPKNISLTSVDERFLNHALEVMESHLGDQQFSVERFAEEMAMSRKNLLRKIKAMTDESVNEFIRNFRLKRAAQLIQAHSGSVSEIAYQVGFNNLSYFSKCFKELFGVLPTEMGSQSSLKIQ